MVVSFAPAQLARVCGFTSSLSAAVALVLFLATPWLAVSCQGETILTQSGLQIVTGGSTVHPAFDMEAKELEEELAEGMEEEEDDLAGAWFFGLFGLGLLASVALGLLLLRTLELNHAAALTACSVLAAVILCGYLLAGFPLENEIEQGIREARQEAATDDDPWTGLGLLFVGMIDVSRSGWVIAATVFSLVSVLAGVLALLAVRSLPRSTT